MQTEEWKRVEELFLAAKGQPPEKRAEFLRLTCPGDPQLRAEVQSLLDADSSAASFLESSPLASALAPGTRLGHFEIQRLIGHGGMGEVYRARDKRLNRTVAIKILPRRLAGQTRIRDRFDREARVISALNHPHICTLYDIGCEDGVDFLVMEYLEGETLGRRLAKGPLPIDQVFRYGIEVVDALTQAHRQGVFHRDLKPGNIMLTESGAKVLDFGLAKMQAVEAGAALSKPASTLTEEGMILGTVQYMAPEQLEGREADARTDVFAFGTVLYEMVTGRKAFEGESRASLIAAILEHEPRPITVLKPMTPVALERLVKKCLAKAPEARWQTARDLKDELEWIAGGSVPSAVPPQRRTNRSRFAWAAAGVLAALAILLVPLYFREKPAQGQLVRFSISPPEKVAFSDPLAISPDGARLALIASVSGAEPSLWVRRLDSLTPQPLPGTDGAYDPFWSPDGEFVAFFAQDKLKKIELATGSVETVCDVREGGTGAWNSDGTIVFRLNETLSQVPAQGGSPRPVTHLNAENKEVAHLWPSFLPDGRHFLFTALTWGRHKDGVYIGSLDSDNPKRIVDSHWMALYAIAPRAHRGYLFFDEGGKLVAQRFDPDSWKLTGPQLALTDTVSDVENRTLFTVSSEGTLAYKVSGTVKTQLTLFDRAGRKLRVVGLPMQDVDASISPDGKRVAVSRAATRSQNSQAIFPAPPGPNDIWIIELAQGIASRLTFDSSAGWPIWSPDGTYVTYASSRDGNLNIYRKAADGAGNEELLFQSSEDKFPNGWSHDGRFLMYSVPRAITGWDLFVLPIRTRTPFAFLQSRFGEGDGRFSPDDKWIVYQATESGEWAIYVRSFNPDASGEAATGAGRWPISAGSGNWPWWAKQGKEILYLHDGTDVMAVDVKLGAGRVGRTVEVGVPKRLFSVHAYGLRCFTATPDGEHFLINTAASEEQPSAIAVLLNWPALIDRIEKKHSS